MGYKSDGIMGRPYFKFIELSKIHTEEKKGEEIDGRWDRKERATG